MSKGKFVESPQKRFERYNNAQSRMDLWRGLLENAYRLTIPNREDFLVRDNIPGRVKADEIFDATGLLGVQAFANNMQTILMPPFRRWAKLIPGEEIPDNRKQEVEEQLQSINQILFRFIDQSNFAQVINESLQDLSVGTGVLIINEGTNQQPFDFLAVPISHVAFEAGAKNQLENFWRRLEVPARQIKRLWPNANLSSKMSLTVQNSPEVKVCLIEGTIFYPENEEGSQYYYYVQEEGSKTDIITEFRPFSPWIGFRFGVSPGEIVGRGPVLTALPSIRVLNKMVEYMIRAAKFRAYPAYMAHSTSVVNPYNMVVEPGSIIPVDSSMGTPIQPLAVGGDPQFAALEINELQAMVRQILFADPLPPNPVPNQTATEISIRQQNWIRQSGASFGRLTVELLDPLVKKCLEVLTRKGLIPSIKVDGKQVSIQYESPLLDIQSQEDVQRVQQWLQNLQITYGQFSVLALEAAKYPAWLAEKMSVDLKLVQSPATVASAFQALQADIKAQLTQQQQQAQAAPGVPAAEPAEAPGIPPFLGGGT